MVSNMSSNRRRVRVKQVFEEADWKCEMPVCVAPSRAIDPALQGYDDPWAPSVDHIVPRAEGGSNRRENMRAAHKRCNNEAGRTITATRVKIRDSHVKGMHVRVGDRYPDLEWFAREIVRSD